MIWPRDWMCRRKRGPSESEQAVRESEQRLNETRAQTPRIRELAAELRQIRADNHFAERIRQALEGS